VQTCRMRVGLRTRRRYARIDIAEELDSLGGRPGLSQAHRSDASAGRELDNLKRDFPASILLMSSASFTMVSSCARIRDSIYRLC